ncbi:MAG: hypothetical protein AAFU41_20240 [Pseudomonadota bacterium]
MPVPASTRIPHLHTLPESAKSTVLRFILLSMNRTSGPERVLGTLAMSAAQSRHKRKRRQA